MVSGRPGRPPDPRTAIRGFLDALDVPADRIPSDPEGQEALYRTVLAGKRVLIVADNARDAAAVRPLLPGSSGCAVLVTSRDRLMGLAVADGAFIVPLEPFTATEADELLIRRLGLERVGAEPDAAAALIEISSRIPLALGIAAALAAAQPGRSARLSGQRTVRPRQPARGAGHRRSDDHGRCGHLVVVSAPERPAG